MTKREQIAFYKRQIITTGELKAVALQNHNLAERIESEAKSALAMLGASIGQTRKGYELSDNIKVSLLGSLTR